MPKLSGGRFIFSAVAVSFLLLLPFYAAWQYIGSRIIFNLFAGDSMYYMAIASNFAKLGIPTVDGGATNGFHPLWLWLLTILFKWPGLTHHNQIYVAFFVSLALVYAAYLLVSFTLVRLLGELPGLLATLLLFPGAYGLLFEPRRHYFAEAGTLYTISPQSAVNGMETPICLALWALLFFLLVQRGLQGHSITSLFSWPARLCLAALTLARLDDGLLLVAIGVFVLLQNNLTIAEKCRTLWRIFWPSAIILALYVEYNLYTVGVALPVSGTNKMIFSSEGLEYLRTVLYSWNTDVWWWFFAIRVFPTFFAMLAGAASLYVGWKYRNLDSSLKCLIVIFGLFLLLKGMFYFLFVPLFNQGYWYYFTLVATVNVMLAIAAAAFLGRQGKEKLAIGFYLILALFHLPNDIHFLNASSDSRLSFNWDHPKTDPQYDQNYADISYALWNQGDAIRHYLQEKAHGATLIEPIDGMFTYLLDMTAQSNNGLASSPVELKRRAEKGYWPSLLSSGSAIIPGYGYCNPKTVHELRITEVLHPPNSPVAFYRVELAKP